MNIIIIKPKSHIVMDSDVYAKGLQQMGHTVTHINIPPNAKSLTIPCSRILKQADIIWCPYEQEIELGLWIKEKLNIPIVGHFEWIPPWRVGDGNVQDWGYSLEQTEQAKKDQPAFTENYIKLLSNYLRCDVLTSPTNYCLETLKRFHKFTDEELAKIRTKPYIVDNDRIFRDEDKTIEKENHILTIGRLVPHKKIVDVVKALSLVKNAPLLKIIGYGEEKENINRVAIELGVNIEFIGVGENESKTREIQKSQFLVTPFASLPAGEAALLKTPTILYDHFNVKEKHGDIGRFVKFNDVTKLAVAIQDWVDHPEKAVIEGKKAYERIINNKSGLKIIAHACQEMLNIFKEALQ